jgi:hypothetical protein
LGLGIKLGLVGGTGINIRNHSWTEIDSGSNIFTDNLEIVKKEAEANAKSKGVVLTSEWQKSA